MSISMSSNASLLRYAQKLLGKTAAGRPHHFKHQLTTITSRSALAPCGHATQHYHTSTIRHQRVQTAQQSEDYAESLLKQQQSSAATSSSQQQQQPIESPRPNIVTQPNNAEQSPILSQASNHTTTPDQQPAAATAKPTLPATAPSATHVTPAKATSPTASKRLARVRIAPITLTESAADRIKTLLSTQNSDTVGIRIGVRSRGCSGLSYTINYVTNTTIKKADDLVEQHGLKVYIDPKSLFYIVGTTMDWVDTELASEFVFNNPKAKSTCGCGESFNV